MILAEEDEKREGAKEREREMGSKVLLDLVRTKTWGQINSRGDLLVKPWNRVNG